MTILRWYYYELLYRLYCAWLALKAVPGLNLGDRVLYDGREWWLSQGVRRPIWTLRPGPAWGLGGSAGVEVHERDFRKVRSLRNYVGSFRFMYRFWMQNWHRIWVHKAVTRSTPRARSGAR